MVLLDSTGGEHAVFVMTWNKRQKPLSDFAAWEETSLELQLANFKLNKQGAGCVTLSGGSRARRGQ